MAKKYKDIVVLGVDVSAWMMDLSGKDYLQVQGRLVAYRNAYPHGTITTELIKHESEFAMFKATVTDNEGRVVATGYGSETLKGFPKGFIEKAETIAVGRALLMAGVGIQYAEVGMEENGESKLADSPSPRKQAPDTGHEANIDGAKIRLKKARESAGLAIDAVKKMSNRIHGTEDLASLTAEQVDRLSDEIENPGKYSAA